MSVKGKIFNQEMNQEKKINNARSVQIKEAKVTLPGGCLRIPVETVADTDVVFVTPSFPKVDPDLWPGQMCSIDDGDAVYINKKSMTVKSPKNAHFTITHAKSQDEPETEHYQLRNPVKLSPLSTDSILKKMKINYTIMTPAQQATLENLHRKCAPVFNNDLTDGYNHFMGRYELSFVFKESSSPPPLKVWAPHYNRTCQV